MPPQTQTFPCPFCGRRMGVGAELLGKHVRCPHCKQVVLAPATGSPGAQPTATPPRPSPPVPKAPEAPAPTFKTPQREGADSILGDPSESEDDVFGSPGSNRVRVPELPNPPPSPPAEPPPSGPRPGAKVAPASANPFAFESETPRPPQGPDRNPPPPSGLIATQVIPSLQPTGDKTQPLAPPPPPPAPPARPTPVPAAPSTQGAATTTATTANPWAGLDALATPAAPAPAAVVAQPVAPPRETRPKDETRARETTQDEDEEPRRGGRAAVPARGGVPAVVVYGLGLYALVMTGLAVYGLVFKSAELPPEHPLSTIPDNFGEFPPADRKKTSAARFPLDGELPADQKAGLGGKIVIGQLVVEPVRIEKRKLTLVRESAQERVEVPLKDGDALVMQLRVSNTSTETAIHPLDPAFLRLGVGTDTPATRIVAGRETFAGGPIAWPFRSPVTREYEKAQEDENRPLGPGESRDYFVCSKPNPLMVNAVKGSREPVLWRVQVRRGLIEFKGKDVPVTAIIGVEFRAADVAGL